MPLSGGAASLCGQMPYTLITVTYGGEVHHSRGYETLRMCEQAKSIALTGMTIEEKDAADKERRRQRELWEAEHPWREPRNDYERLVAGGGGSGCIIGPGCLEWLNGKVRETYPADFSMSLIKREVGIKYAKCVIEPEGSSE